MSEKSKKIDPNYVSQRVQQTKKEIEQLKLELQKLINRGIESDRPNNSNAITVSENKHRSKDVPSLGLQSNPYTKRASTYIPKRDPTEEERDEEVLPRKVKPQHIWRDVSSLPIHSNVHKKQPSTFAPKRDYNKEERNEEVSSKKVKHYNVEEAREYIRKQKEKRMETLKLQVQASQNVIDTRKEKLKELQKKSLELVQKNVHLKRDRSRSKETKILVEEKEVPHNGISLNRNVESTDLEENPHTVPDLIVNDIKEVPAVCSNKNQNVQAELKNICVRESVDKAEVTFGDLLKQYRDVHHRAAVRIQSYYRGYRQRKLFEKIKKRKRKKLNIMAQTIKPAINADNAEKPKEVSNVPFWLQTAIQPYPYNFISTVKKKLNLAANAPVKTSSDIGVQISMEDPEKINKVNKTKDEIKKAIEESIRGVSFESHKCLNLKSVKDLHLYKDKFRDFRNDCDITKHSDKILEKQTHSKPKGVNLLESETSESDTSKNIPDISSESSVSVSSIAHSTNRQVSDYKLEINSNKLKGLKLRGRRNDIMENTMDLLSDNTRKDDKILLREMPQIGEYVERSNRTKSSDNIQEDLSSIGRKSKRTSSAPLLQNIHATSHESARSESVSEISHRKASKSDSNISNVTSYKSKSNNTISQKISKSESHISTISDPNKLSKKSNLISDRNAVMGISKTRKPTGESHNDPLESDENLQSFLEYMDSLENSKKSAKSLQKKSSSTKNSNSFKTLPDKSEKTSESVNDSAKSEKENYSSNFSNSTSSVISSVPLLKRPSVTLTTSKDLELPIQEENKNSISIKPGEVKCFETKTNTNQIHLKFEAELHLLNDFNESLRQFMAVEKSLFELHGKSQQNTTIYQNQDTQTTIPFPPNTTKKSNDTIASEISKSQRSERTLPTITYERGCDFTDFQKEDDNSLNIPEELQQDNNRKSSDVVDDVRQEISNYTINKDDIDKSIFTGLELSQLNESVNSTANGTTTNVSFPANDYSFNSNIYVGFSIGMFDQLIRDEDARIENLKTILKIREKALLDRTKGELAWLEIQKKQLIETGQLHEASLLKKKQRGIIIKLQHEKQEMQRLKQIQNAASKERKTILKEQRNMIKAQLSNNNAVPKIRRSVQKGRRHLGPVKVYNLHRETINTETSISRRSSVAEEIIITSRSESIVGQISEEAAGDHDASMIFNTSFKSITNKRTEEAKKSLLMREAALQKRKKAAEDLLQWHQRLLEEERKIAELEMAANTIIKQVPAHLGDNLLCKGDDEKYDFKGAQLNFLWTNMTGKNEKKFEDDETYSLDQMALEKFCADARKNLAEDIDVMKSAKSESSIKSDSLRSGRSKKSISNVDTVSTYSSEFDSSEIVEEADDKSNTEILVDEIDRSKSTLNEIIQNISNITDEISAIYKLSSVANTIKDESVLPSVKIAGVTNSIIRENGDDIPAGDESKDDDDDTLKSSAAQSEIVRSLTELISSQNACQDIKPERKRNIIETPESAPSKNTHTDSQGTLASNIELCTDSNKPGAEINNIIGDVGTEVSLHTDLNKESPREDAVQDSVREENAERGVVVVVNGNDLRNENNESVTIEMCSVNNASKHLTAIEEDDTSKSVIYDLNCENNEAVATEISSLNDVSKHLTTIEEDDNYSDDTSKSVIYDLNYESNGAVATDISPLDDVSKHPTTIEEDDRYSDDTSKSVLHDLNYENNEAVATDYVSKHLTTIEEDDRYSDDTSKNAIHDLNCENNEAVATKRVSPVVDDVSKHPTTIEEDDRYSDDASKSVLHDLNYGNNEAVATDYVSKHPTTIEEDDRYSDDTSKSAIQDLNYDNTGVVATEILPRDGVSKHPTIIEEDDRYSDNTSKSAIQDLNYENTGVVTTEILPRDGVSKHPTIIEEDDRYSDNTSKSVIQDLNYENTGVVATEILPLDGVSKHPTIIEEDDRYSDNTSKSAIQDLNYENTGVVATEILPLDGVSKHPTIIEEDDRYSDNTSKSVIQDLNHETNGVVATEISLLDNASKIHATVTAGSPGIKRSGAIFGLNNEFPGGNEDVTTETNISKNHVTTVEESHNSKVGDTASKSAAQNILDLSYGFIGARIRKSELTSDGDQTSVSSELPLENGFSDKLQIPNDICDDDLVKSPELEEEEEEETTVSTESSFEKSIHEDNVISNSIKLSSRIKSSDLINNNEKVIEDDAIDENSRNLDINRGNLLIEDIHSGGSISKNMAVSESSNEDIIESITQKSKLLNDEGIVLNLEKLYDIEEGKPFQAHDAISVKRRVSEILADTAPSREDKSPRLQDIYTTTYDVSSPEHSPETGSPGGSERNIAVVTQLYDEEAEALFKKQLAIEQEIKQLEQQQKEHIPYIYMREIPNKPPPPYTPPGNQTHAASVLPASVEQLHSITSYISEILYRVHRNGGSIENIAPNITDEQRIFSKLNVDKDCYEYLFDLCKEFAVEHYKQFVEQTGPSWIVVDKKSLAKRKPFDRNDLKSYLFKMTKEILGFEKVVFKEKMITKWSRKKRDHVDEILVIESQAEESEWTNYDEDEVIVKNEVTNDIMNMLLTETADVISKIFRRKMNLSQNT